MIFWFNVLYDNARFHFEVNDTNSWKGGSLKRGSIKVTMLCPNFRKGGYSKREFFEKKGFIPQSHFEVNGINSWKGGSLN